MTPLGWGLLSVAVARVEPERAGGVVEVLVFDNLPLSKARKQDKPDIAASLVEEVRPLSGHGQ